MKKFNSLKFLLKHSQFLLSVNLNQNRVPVHIPLALLVDTPSYLMGDAAQVMKLIEILWT